MDNASESPTILLPNGVTMPRLRSALLSFSKCAFFLALLIACLFIIATPLSAQQAPVLVTQPVDNSVRTVLPGNVHPLARPDFDQGEAPSDLILHRMMLVLKRSAQQETTLQRLIENQQNKKSASYHKWLTPAEFGAQFGPADSDVAAVTNWLLASGFQVNSVSNGRTVIEFNGTAGQVKQAFGTAIHSYVVKGEQHWANASDPSIPTALAPVIAGVNSLSGFRRKAQNIYVGTYSEKTKQLTSPNPNITYTGACGYFSAADSCYALGPYDFANIYDVLPLWTAATPINGTGVTIAIVGDTYINENDAPTFWGLFGFGQPGYAPMPTLNITCDGPCPGFNGDEPEADIDTQWSGAVAPGATIDFVTAEDTETDYGIDLAALHIVDNNLAPVMSESYGDCELDLTSNGVAFYGAIWEQAAAQGITVMVSAGDQGSAGCDFDASAAQYGLNVNGIASTPWNVAVGGTDFNQYNNWSTYWNSTNNATTQQSVKNNTYIPETTWNNSCTNLLLQNLTGGSPNPETNCNNLNFGAFLAVVGGSGGESGLSGGVGLGYGWGTPTWQTGAGVPTSPNSRFLPDVSLLASNGFVGSFYVICQSDVSGACTLDNLQGYGGTSVASPAFAGIMALVNQAHGPQGNANLVLYNLASYLAAHPPSAFHDVPVGSTIAMPCYRGYPNCVTNVGTDAYGVLSGYSTTANYDLATGLGSVDANKLVTDWGDVSFTPTTTTIVTLSVPANTVHGTGIPVKVKAAPTSGSGTPTGDVSLLVSPKPGAPSIDWASLGSGSASWTTYLLPGGTYSVIAHYGGDKTYGGSYSTASTSITIDPEASSVYMGSTPGLLTPSGYSTSVIYGTGAFDEYVLRADVYSVQNGQCTDQVFGEVGCPTGSIRFSGDTNPVPYSATLNLNSLGYTEDQSIQLSGGAHTLIATYSGDASYKTSSTTAMVNVAKATSLISNVSAPSTANINQQFTVTATVNTSLTANTSYGLAPSGTVSFFYSGTQLLGTVQTTPTNGSYNPFTGAGTPASLAASLTTSIPTAGTYNITATYSGDGNYTAVTAGQSNSVQITVSNTTSDFTNVISNSPLTAYPFQNATFNGTLTAEGGYNSAVNLTCTGAPPSTCTLSPTQVTPTTGGAAYTVTAGGNTGDYNFNAHAVGTDAGTTTHDAAITLHVVDFELTSVSPATVTAPQGFTGTGTFKVTASGSFAQTVTLSCPGGGLPAQATCSFSPSSTVNPTAGNPVSVTMTVNTTGSTPQGTTNVTLQGVTSGPAATRAETFSLTVGPPPDFTFVINGSNTHTVLAGQTTQAYSFTVTAAGGAPTFLGQVAFTCPAGLPALATCSNPTISAGASSPQTVMMTIATTGPNSGTGPSIQRRADNRSPWLPLSVPLAGIVMFGIAGRKVSRRSAIAFLCISLVLLGFMVACGSSSSSTPPPVGITISPNTPVNLYFDEAGNSWPAAATEQQYTANVTNSTNTAVTWEVNGVAGGNATFGTITAAGLYTAPATLPTPATFNVTAVAQADTTKTAPDQVNIQTPTATGTYTPTVTVTEGVTQHSLPAGITLIVQ